MTRPTGFTPYTQFCRDGHRATMSLVHAPGGVSTHAIPLTGDPYRKHAGEGCEVAATIAGDELTVEVTLDGAVLSCVVAVSSIPTSGYSKVTYLRSDTDDAPAGRKRSARRAGDAQPKAASDVSAEQSSGSRPGSDAAPASSVAGASAAGNRLFIASVAALVDTVVEEHNQSHTGAFRWCSEPVCLAVSPVQAALG